MKIKPSKKCRNEGCSNTFKPFRTTDKYCSLPCAKEAQKDKTIKSFKKVSRIKQISEKRKKEDSIYRKKRKAFMLKYENKFCPVCRAAFEGKININKIMFNDIIKRNKGLVQTNECHHLAGKVGKLYTDTNNFLAVSSIGHRWIHDNPQEARKHGFLIKSTIS